VVTVPAPSCFELVVSVGTDHHPFDRLMGWIGGWLATAPGAEVFVQCGTSKAPAGVESASLVERTELRRRFSSASAVVVQGGPGGIIDSLECGRRPIVVPRVSRLGEHVDDHQVAFARHLARLGEVRLAETEEQLRAELAAAVADPGLFRVPPRRDPGPATALRLGALVDELVRARQGRRSRVRTG
jgi:UDP-N-acetylglucosamine transferase subunit ALG13